MISPLHLFLICSKWHYSRQVSWPYNPAQNRHISQVPVESTLAFEIFVLRHIAVNPPSLLSIRPYRVDALSFSCGETPKKNFRTFSRWLPRGTQMALKTRQISAKSLKTGKSGKTGKMLVRKEIFQKIFPNFFESLGREEKFREMLHRGEIFPKNFSQNFSTHIDSLITLYVIREDNVT